MLKKRVTCFNCADKIVAKKAFTVRLNTLDGAHEVKLCEKCASEFDQIMIELEQTISQVYTNE